MPKSSDQLRLAAISVVSKLREQGACAYFAGGCVRDTLLGNTPKDYDIATDMKPDAVLALFNRSQYVGQAFGVVLVKIDTYDFEVATFRHEWGYTDGRRPDGVEFTDAKRDAQRRDFTINGLFEDPLTENKDEQIIDYVEGVKDLNAKTIRAIGVADERFGEDYLRMLRAVRFAARLDFEIEENTQKAIQKHASKLDKISKERIGIEIRQMLSSQGKNEIALKLMHELKLEKAVLGKASAGGQYPASKLLASQDPASYPVAIMCWLFDWLELGQGLESLAVLLTKKFKSIIKKWRIALCLTNFDCEALLGIITLIGQAADWQSLSVAKRKRMLGHPCWIMTRRFLGAVPNLEAHVLLIDHQSLPLIAQGVCPDPFIDGADLIKQGLTPGPSFKRILNEVYDLQLEHDLLSRGQALAWITNQL